MFEHLRDSYSNKPTHEALSHESAMPQSDGPWTRSKGMGTKAQTAKPGLFHLSDGSIIQVGHLPGSLFAARLLKRFDNFKANIGVTNKGSIASFFKNGKFIGMNHTQLYSLFKTPAMRIPSSDLPQPVTVHATVGPEWLQPHFGGAADSYFNARSKPGPAASGR